MIYSPAVTELLSAATAVPRKVPDFLVAARAVVWAGCVARKPFRFLRLMFMRSPAQAADSDREQQEAD